MKIRFVLMSLLAVVLLVPSFSEAAKKIQVRIRGVYSDYNPDGTSVSKVVTASCQGAEVATGGGCTCFGKDFDSKKINYGVLNACTPSSDGKSFFGGCFADAGVYSSSKSGPGITVYVKCLVGGTTVQSATSDRSAGTEPPTDEEPVLTPAEEISDSDLSPQALEMKQQLEDQAQARAEAMKKGQ